MRWAIGTDEATASMVAVSKDRKFLGRCSVVYMSHFWWKRVLWRVEHPHGKGLGSAFHMRDAQNIVAI